jgi:hypothetical protein
LGAHRHGKKEERRGKTAAEQGQRTKSQRENSRAVDTLRKMKQMKPKIGRGREREAGGTASYE